LRDFGKEKKETGDLIAYLFFRKWGKGDRTSFLFKGVREEKVGCTHSLASAGKERGEKSYTDV